MTAPSRRHFRQATAAVTASLVLPRSVVACRPDRSCWFLHADNLDAEARPDAEMVLDRRVTREMA